METSITSETISQHTMYKNNESSYTEADKEQIKLQWKQNQLSKAREIYFQHFSSQKMAWTKATVWKCAMMGLPLVPSIKGKPCHSQKGTTPKIGVKRLEKIQLKMGKVPTHQSLFWPGTKALCEIRKFQKSTKLLVLKASFLRLVREIMQKEHGDHQTQAGAVLALHEATKAYIICQIEDTNLCAIHAKCIMILPWDMRLAYRIMGKNVKW